MSFFLLKKEMELVDAQYALAETVVVEDDDKLFVEKQILRAVSGDWRPQKNWDEKVNGRKRRLTKQQKADRDFINGIPHDFRRITRMQEKKAKKEQKRQNKKIEKAERHRAKDLSESPQLLDEALKNILTTKRHKKMAWKGEWTLEKVVYALVARVETLKNAA